MTVKTINDLAGPNSIVSTLLVFSIYSQLIKIDPSSSLVTKRAKDICVTIKKVCCFYTKRQIKDALIIRNSLNIKNTLDLFL